MAKALCMVGVAITAMVVRNRLLPLIAQRRTTALVLWCSWELVVLAVAFGVAVVLTRTSITPF